MISLSKLLKRLIKKLCWFSGKKEHVVKIMAGFSCASEILVLLLKYIAYRVHIISVDPMLSTAQLCSRGMPNYSCNLHFFMRLTLFDHMKHLFAKLLPLYCNLGTAMLSICMAILHQKQLARMPLN